MTVSEVITVGNNILNKLCQYMAITAFNGTDSYTKYFEDAGMVYSFIKALEFEETYPDSLTWEEKDNCIHKILEYYFVLDLTDPTYIGSAYEDSSTEVSIDDEGRSEYQIVITYNGENVFNNIPFDVDDVDLESIDLYVNGVSIPYNTSIAEDGFHMVNTDLYWHYFYELKLGDIVILKWG